jgi:hypothetical protein
MDGVIADFNKYYKSIYHMEPREAEKREEFRPLFHELIMNGGFEKLDLMPDAHLGLEFLRKSNVPTQILSSTSREQYFNPISKQKTIWLQKQGITFNPIFVPGKQYKQQYAKPDTIIIDDTLSIIDDWRKAGGIAIWHKNWQDTLAILRQYV